MFCLRRTSCSKLLYRCKSTVVSAKIAAKDRPRYVQMENGEKVPHIFSDEEFQTRIAKLRRYMSINDINCCLLTSYHNVNYYCGYKLCTLGRNYGLVVGHDDCSLITSGVDGGQPWRRSKGVGNIVYTDWHKDNFFHALKFLIKDVKGKLGVELDVLSVDNYNKLNVALPYHPKTDVGEATMMMRLVKSREEIALMRQGARIADEGGWAAVEAMEDGVSESVVAQHATNTMVKEITKTFPQSDIMDTWSWIQSGVNTDGAHNPVTSRKIHRGDIVSLNCFPMIQGYFAALERTLFLGHVSDDHRRLWHVNCEVHKRGLELVRPGIRCCDVVDELNEIYIENELLEYRTIGYGHSLGNMCHYYGREAALELREDITTVLQPGMVLSMEPMIVIPDGQPGSGGYREHDILVVTEHGNENLTNFPYGPEANVIKK